MDSDHSIPTLEDQLLAVARRWWAVRPVLYGDGAGDGTRPFAIAAERAMSRAIAEAEQD